jgi:hypothetical protein
MTNLVLYFYFTAQVKELVGRQQEWEGNEREHEQEVSQRVVGARTS